MIFFSVRAAAHGYAIPSEQVIETLNAHQAPAEFY
jgi:hypothetical protein